MRLFNYSYTNIIQINGNISPVLWRIYLVARQLYLEVTRKGVSQFKNKQKKSIRNYSPYK